MLSSIQDMRCNKHTLQVQRKRRPRQIWTRLPVYLLLRFISWKNHRKHSFSRLYTLIRGVLQDFFDLPSVILCCDTTGRRGRNRNCGMPEKACQMFFLTLHDISCSTRHIRKRRCF